MLVMLVSQLKAVLRSFVAKVPWLPLDSKSITEELISGLNDNPLVDEHSVQATSDKQLHPKVAPFVDVIDVNTIRVSPVQYGEVFNFCEAKDM